MDLCVMDPLLKAYSQQEDEVKMKEWMERFKPVCQGEVWQETTKDKDSTLAIALCVNVKHENAEPTEIIIDTEMPHVELVGNVESEDDEEEEKEGDDNDDEEDTKEEEGDEKEDEEDQDNDDDAQYDTDSDEDDASIDNQDEGNKVPIRSTDQ